MTPIDPGTAKHLISDQGEVVIDEVHKHWAAAVSAILEMAGGVLVACLAVLNPQYWWVPVLIGLAIELHAAWRMLDHHVDRFVITNMRVFRIHGILSQRIATMPLARILDISVYKPFIGRIFGYGHFVFESAAQEQGLREIRYVGRPDERGLTIQRVIQQAGLRGFAGQQGGMMRPQPTSAPASDPTADTMPGVPGAPPRPPMPRRTFDTAPYGSFDPDDTRTDPIHLPR